MHLFVAEKELREKIANVELEEDATQWPRQVLTELFRVLPEIAEYTPDVRFIKSNEEQGYAVGVVVVTNSTNSALASQETQGASQPKALVPVIIKNGKLSPLDTLMASSGKMYPLTVDRLREVLYRPESFELVTDDWGDNALWQLFAPPGGTGMGGAGGGTGMGGVQYMMGPGMKQASLLALIESTVLEPDIEAVTAKLAEDEAFHDAAFANPAMAEYLDKLAEVTPVGAESAAAMEQALDDIHPVDVALMRYDDAVGLYAVKTANRRFGVLRSEYMPRGEFLRFAGDKIAAAVDAEGAAVASAPSGEAVIVAAPGGERARLISRSGFYHCYEATTGKTVPGWVITNPIDGEGNRVPIVVFANADGACTQDAIAGSEQYSGREDMPNDPVKGQGSFYCGQAGELQGTVPLTVKGSTSDGESTHYNCVDLTGEEITVTLQRGMRAVAAFPERKELVLPASAGFISLEHPMPALVSKGEDVEAKYASFDSRLTITSDPAMFEHFHVRYQGLPKLAAALTDLGTDYQETLYALCVAGLDADTAHQALSKVAQQGRCEVTASDLGGYVPVPVEKIAERVSRLHELRPALIKEAAALPDAMTVDAVLSLDFINSENVRTFISQIPYLEKALSKICELVFASRLGLAEIPETAAARAARGLNDTIRGLKALALRQIEELP